MNEERKIQLVFNTENNKTLSIYIDEPKEPYNEQDIKEAMEAIITNNVISGKNGAVVGIKGAYYITRTKQDIILP
mgnify:CR=1 FL=1|jgi:phosphoribosylformylglycinamidine (FGAM) synthase PurS component